MQLSFCDENPFPLTQPPPPSATLIGSTQQVLSSADVIDPVLRNSGPARKNDHSSKKRKRRSRSRSHSRSRSKGKRRAPDDSIGKRGRATGSKNFSQEDINMLLDCVQDVLPIGQKGWALTEKAFNDAAKLGNRPERTSKSLEAKYKQVCYLFAMHVSQLIGHLQLIKTRKPTGSGYRPPHIERAHEIEEEIASRIGMRDLNESDYADAISSEDNSSASGSSDSDSDEEPKTKTARIRTAKAVRAPSPLITRPSARTASRTSSGAADLVTAMSRALHPDVQRRRDIERTERMTASSQLLMLQQQMRDQQQQIFELQGRLQDAYRARDRAELKLEMMDRPFIESGVRRGRRKVREESRTMWPDGGEYRGWVTVDTETDSDYVRDELRVRNNTHYQPPRQKQSSLAKGTSSSNRCTDQTLRLPLVGSTSRAPASSNAPLVNSPLEVSVTPSRAPEISVFISPQHTRSNYTYSSNH